MGIVQEIMDGFNLIGNCGGGAALPPDFQPATFTAKGLEIHSGQNNKAIMHSTKSSGMPEVDKELWKKTKEEQAKGWLKELDAPPKDGGRVSRRFAVVQSEESQINDAATIVNRCTVDGADTIAATISKMMKELRAAGKNSTLLARSYDLKSSYRQLAVSNSSLKWSRIAVFCPVRSTFKRGIGFLRAARMLQWVALKLGLI